VSQKLALFVKNFVAKILSSKKKSKRIKQIEQMTVWCTNPDNPLYLLNPLTKILAEQFRPLELRVSSNVKGRNFQTAADLTHLKVQHGSR